MTQNYANFISQFPVWPQNQLRFPGFEPVLSQTEMPHITGNFLSIIKPIINKANNIKSGLIGTQTFITISKNWFVNYIWYPKFYNHL